MLTYCQILGAIYVFLDGCIQGEDCSEGKHCRPTRMTVDTFDECEANAMRINADGFSFSRQYSDCRMCTNNELADLVSYANYGVYGREGKCTFMVIIHGSRGCFKYITIR